MKRTLLLMLTFLLSAHLAVAQSEAEFPRDGLLLLKNGRYLEGHIQRDGERYVVQIRESELRIPVSQVALVCKDLLDAYHQQYAMIQPRDIYGHLKLADWCLYHRLADQATEQIHLAEAIDPNDPRLPLLRRRRSSLAENRQARTSQPEITKPSGPTGKELDTFTAKLPETTVAKFTKEIQPILQNRCATSGCHGIRSEEEFRMIRIPVGSPPRRRVTQHNLWEAVAQIDKQNLGQSPLLLKALRRHGKPNSKAVAWWSSDSEQYRALSEWVYGFSGETPQLADHQPKPDVNIYGIRPVSAEVVVPETNLPPGPAKVKSPEQELPLPAWARGETDRIQVGAEEKKFVPKDPFDPAIFNRRFRSEGPQRQASPGTN